MTDRRVSRRLAWLGWGLERLGLIAIAAWAGLTAGWIALSLGHRSGGWLGVLSLVFGLYLVLPGGLLFLGGRFLRQRQGVDPERPVVLAGQAVCLVVAAAGAVFAYSSGWPR